MGWASGSELMSEVLAATLPHIPKKKRKAVVAKLVEAFQAQDCDTLEECADEFPIVLTVLREIDPDLYEDDESD